MVIENGPLTFIESTKREEKGEILSRKKIVENGK
jgi:hypothetical protein